MQIMGVFKRKILETITTITRMYIQFLCYQAKYTKIKNILLFILLERC